MIFFGGGAFVGFVLFNASIAAVNQTHVTPTPTLSPTPTPIIAPQQQMSYADWQKQEAARVNADSTSCYTNFSTRYFGTIAFVDNYNVAYGKIIAWTFVGSKSVHWGPGEIDLKQSETICTGKRNGEPFTEVQSVVRWDSAGNEIENVTFVRG